MTKDAVRRTYREILNRLTAEITDVVAEEFGGGLLGKVAGRGAKPILDRINTEMQRQGRIIVEYTAATDESERDHLRRQFLETNPVYSRYDGERITDLENDLLSHFEAAAADLEPLVDSPTDDFWSAMTEVYTREEAETIIDRHFSQAETFTQYRDGVFTSRTIGDRVISVVEDGEERLRTHLMSELERAYAEAESGNTHGP